MTQQLFPSGPPSIENGAHGTEKLLLKTQVSEDFAQWRESNNIINYFIFFKVHKTHHGRSSFKTLFRWKRFWNGWKWLSSSTTRLWDSFECLPLSQLQKMFQVHTSSPLWVCSLFINGIKYWFIYFCMYVCMCVYVSVLFYFLLLFCLFYMFWSSVLCLYKYKRKTWKD